MPAFRPRLKFAACGVALLFSGFSVEARTAPLVDLEGNAVDPFRAGNAKATIFLFVRTDCPISNSYAPEIRRIHQKFAGDGVAFWLVYIDPAETKATIDQHIRDFDLPGRALLDPKLAFAAECGASVTPEAAVFSRSRERTYIGRIDDRYVAFGKRKFAPSTHDLEDALTATLAGKRPPAAAGPAIGCLIKDLR